MGQVRAERNYNLDLLRFFACFAVIGLHTLRNDLEIDISPLNGALYYLCGFAVPVFFTCSGYFLLSKKEITAEYVIKKIISIIRIVFIWSFSFTTLIFVSKFVLQRNDQYTTLFNYLSQITFKPYIQKGYTSYLWYLGALGIIYIFSPFILKLVDHDMVKRLTLWGFSGLICVIIQIISIIKGRPIQSHVHQIFRIWTWNQYFLMGGGIAYILPVICKKISNTEHFFALCGCSAFMVIYKLFIGYNVFHDLVSCEYYYDDIFEMIWVFLLFTFFLRVPIKNETVIGLIKGTQPLILGAYIFHPILIYFFLKIFKLFNANILSEAIRLFVTVSVCSFAVAYMMSKIPIVKHSIKI